MPIEIAAALIGSVAVVAGSWIAARLTYQYERERDAKANADHRRVLASAMIQELMLAESLATIYVQAAANGVISPMLPRLPLLERVPDVAGVFEPSELNALIEFHSAFRRMVKAQKRARARQGVAKEGGIPAAQLAETAREWSTIIASHARTVLGAESDAYNARLRSGAETPGKYAATQLQSDHGVFGPSFGWKSISDLLVPSDDVDPTTGIARPHA